MNGNRRSYLQNVNTYNCVLVGIILWGISIRLIGLNKGIWLDEYSSLKVISHENFLETLRAYDHPPLYFAVLKSWSLMSVEESFLRLLSVVFGVGTVTITMLWMKQYSDLASILAGTLCATAPIMLRYSHEIRDYSLLLFATTLSYFFASRLKADQEALLNYFGLTISLTIAVTTHLIGVMLVTSICLFIVLSLPNRRRVFSVKFIIAIVVPCIAFLFTYFVFLEQVPTKDWWMPAPSFKLVLNTTKYVSGWNALFWPLPIIQRSTHLLAITLDRLIKLLVVTIGCLLLFGNWRLSFPLFVAATFYWLQLLAYSFLQTPVFWYRTVLPGMVPLFGFVGLQTATIRWKKIKLLLVISLVLLSLHFTANWIVNDAEKPYERWKEIAQLLDKRWDSDSLVVFCPTYVEGPIRYYMPDLPSEMVIGFDVNTDDVDKIKADIEARALPVIFLVVRHDLILERNIETYHELLEYLESNFGHSALSYDLGILSLTKYERE